jgi:hypothetical protein
MRAVVLLIVGLAIGAALGWQGQVHAASGHRSDDVVISVGATAVFRSIGESCDAVRWHYAAAHGGLFSVLCYQTLPRKNGYVVNISRRSITVYKPHGPLTDTVRVRQVAQVR